MTRTRYDSAFFSSNVGCLLTPFARFAACSGLAERPAMCLGIPGKVLETYRENDVLMGKVDFSGIRKGVCLEHVPQARPGDYVLVHVGFALSVLDEEEAGRVFAFLQ